MFKGDRFLLLFVLIFAFIAEAKAMVPFVDSELRIYDVYTVGRMVPEFVPDAAQRNTEEEESYLFLIDPDTNGIRKIGATGFIRCTALDHKPNGDLVANCHRPQPPYEPVLVRLDQFTGRGTEIGETGIPGIISDMAINSEGLKFAYEMPGKEAHNLYQVDPATGEGNFVGSPGLEGQGNALFFWGPDHDLKLFTWFDGVNRLYELDKATGQPNFLKNIIMVDTDGNETGPEPCIAVAMDSLRDPREETVISASGTRQLDTISSEAVGLIEFPDDIVPFSAGVDTRMTGDPKYGLGLLDFDTGVLTVGDPIDSGGYVLDGIAAARILPRPIPTMSEWSILGFSGLLLLCAVYFMSRRKIMKKA